MKKAIIACVVLSLMGFVSSSRALAQTSTAAASGNWVTSSTWVGGTVPTPTSSVVIGSTTPSGAALSATVTLTVPETVSNLFLGNGNGTSGTISLGGNALAVSSQLVIGESGTGTGTINEGGGSFTAGTLSVQNGNSFTFGANDVVNALNVTGASSLTTVATGNIVGITNTDTFSNVESGSTLKLGANMNAGVFGFLNVQDSGSTFNMNNFSFTGNELQLGYNGSAAVTVLNRGTLDVATLNVGNGMAFNINAGDTVTTFNLSGGTSTLNANVNQLNLFSGATATTTSTGSIVGITNTDTFSNVESGSTLKLGANLNAGVFGFLNVQDSGSTFNMNGFSFTGNELQLGYNGSSAVTVLNRGTLDVATLNVGNGMAFNINAGDTVTTFNLSGGTSTLNANVNQLNLFSGATATTTSTGSIVGITNTDTFSNVESGSTLKLGANMNAGVFGFLNVQDSGSTFNMNGFSFTGNELQLGYNGSSAVTVLNRGTLDVATLNVGNGMAFNINAGDTVTTFNLSGGTSTLNANVNQLNLFSGATATTTSTGSIVGITNTDTFSNVESGSTLKLGANMNAGVFGFLNVQDSGSTFNMNNFSFTGNELQLGYNGSSAVTVLNRGTLDVATLNVGNGMAFNINAGDTVTTFNLSGGTSTLNANVNQLNLFSGATATTTSTGSIVGITNTDTFSNVESGSTLNLGASLNLGVFGFLNVQDSGSTLNAHGFGLTGNTLEVGFNGTSAVNVINLGQVTLNTLDVGNSTAGSNLTLHGGDVINSQINLQNGSMLTVQQVNGIGLTLNGTQLSSLTIDPSSMDLIFNLNTAANWDFRWADPNGSNWISTLDAMIASGQIVVTSPDGFTVVNNPVGFPTGYTYIMGGISTVPEPSSLVLAGLAVVGVAAAIVRQRRRTSRGRPIS